MILNSQMKLQVDKAMARAEGRALRLTALSALAEEWSLVFSALSSGGSHHL